MNTKTTLFFALIIFAHVLMNISSSKVKIAIRLRKDLAPSQDMKDLQFAQVASDSKNSASTKAIVSSTSLSEAKVNLNSMSSAKTKTKTEVEVKSLEKEAFSDVEFSLKNPQTLEPYSYIPGLEFTLVDLERKTTKGDYNGTSVVFKNLAKGTYSIRITSLSTNNFEETFTYDGNNTKNTLFLVEYLNENEWLVVLSWKNGVGKFISGEVSEGHLWDQGLNEQQKIIKSNYGPQTVKFEIIKGNPEKSFASYEVYNKSGYSNIFDTGASVAVYNGKKLVKSYSVPQVPIVFEGTELAKFWSVFQIVADDEIPYHELNQISSVTSMPDWFV